MRIQYRHPKIYDFLISFVYPRKLTEEISKEVGKNNSVLDVAAGYGRMSRFIDSSNSYYGIGANKEFVKHGQSMGLDLRLADIFNSSLYKQSDVVLVIDVVHHLASEKLEELFDMVFSHASKKVVVVEPAFTEISQKYGFIGKAIGWFFRMMDDDGINKITRWLTHQEYEQMFENRFNSEPGNKFLVSHRIVSGHHLAVFQANLL